MSPAHAVSKISELIVVCDQSGHIQFVSRSFARLFSITPQKCLGSPFSPGGDIAEEGRPACYRTSANVQGKEVTIAWTETVLSGGERLYAGTPAEHMEEEENGTEAHLLLPPTPLAQDRDPEAHDPRLKLLATMSHEMRTPLNGILGMTNLLLESDLSPNQRSYAENVRECGAALLALINDLLDYSKMGAGRVALEEKVFSPQNLVQSVAELLSPKAAEKNIEIASFIDPEIPSHLYADEGRLRQVLINLAGNSVKFTDEGGISLELKLISKNDHKACIGFSVNDTGVGIAPEMQQKIFDEYEQAGDDFAKAKEGTGLGLTIARAIVRSMQSDIKLVSKLGHGSHFSFELELDYEEREEENLSTITRPVVIATKNKLLARALTAQIQGFSTENVFNATSADEACDYLHGLENAILLADRDIAEAKPEKLASSSTCAYVLLSVLERGHIDPMTNSGFHGYFIKPLRQKTLLNRLTTSTQGNLSPADTAIPKTQKAPKKEKAVQNQPQQTNSTKGPRTILLAEDNRVNAVLATTIIRREGHTVDVAVNGEKAFIAAKEKDYDLVLMDMHMPDVDGVEATRRIRALGGRYEMMPIIALTASANALDRERCLEAGMNDFLTKPFEPDHLTNVINKWAMVTDQKSKAS